MANYSTLIGCPNAESLSDDALTNAIEAWNESEPVYRAAWGPSLQAKYCVPIYWLCLFAPGDQIAISSRYENLDGTHQEVSEPIWCCAVSLALQRLADRLPNLLVLMPDDLQESYRCLALQFADYIREHFEHALALDLRDIFSMGPAPEHVASLVAAISEGIGAEQLREMPAVGELSALPNFSWSLASEKRPPHPALWRAELFGFSRFGPEWPPSPSSAEYDFAWFLEPPVAQPVNLPPADLGKKGVLSRWLK